jgi:hypothetical protein
LTRNPRGASAEAAQPASVPRIPFDSLMAIHRGARRRNQLAFWLLLLIGLVIVGLGFTGTLPQLPAIITGVVTIAVAVFPYCEMVERDERLEGLQVLEDEWRGAMQGGTPQQDTDRFIELLWKLYGKS